MLCWVEGIANRLLVQVEKFTATNDAQCLTIKNCTMLGWVKVGVDCESKVLIPMIN